MKLNEYQKLAKETAIYPATIAYPALGLCGETAELIIAMDDSDKKAVKEVGDCLWYVANLAFDCGLPLSEVFDMAEFPKSSDLDYKDFVLEKLILQAGLIAETVKKAIRDNNGVVSGRKKLKIKTHLQEYVYFLNEAAHSVFTPLGKCAKMNIKKLRSRQERNVLKGDGDER